MNSNYRETKYDLVPCPFNPIHKVKKYRLITHKKKCPDRNKNGFLECPYDANHIVTIPNLEKHKQICPNKVIINPDLEKEMIAYIKNLKNNKKKYNPLNTVMNSLNNYGNNDKIENKENLGNNINKIEKKISKNINNKNKIKNKKNNNHIKETTINLENMTNKDLFNFFNDNMVIEYNSDSENDDDYINGNIYI